jgi:hypothetical protein
VPPSKYRNWCLLSAVESDERWEMNAYTDWKLIAMKIINTDIDGIGIGIGR